MLKHIDVCYTSSQTQSLYIQSRSFAQMEPLGTHMENDRSESLIIAASGVSESSLSILMFKVGYKRCMFYEYNQQCGRIESKNCSDAILVEPTFSDFF